MSGTGAISITLTLPFPGDRRSEIRVENPLESDLEIHGESFDRDGYEKHEVGDLPAEDYEQLKSLLLELRGLPTHGNRDIYHVSAKLVVDTPEVQWSNAAAGEGEVTAEQKEKFMNVLDCLQKLAEVHANWEDDLM